jgi:2-polyprenyl-3-methyl-5-hydroxy-6-metoxy-1,4-benzoquinol methylase
MSEHAAVNKAFWDDVAPHHARSDFYAVEAFIADPDRLGTIETTELGDVAGRSICHLQCHIGLDTLSLARRGAAVTGLDFSDESLRVARELSERTGIPATFVQSDVLAAADTLNTTYDVVFTTRGVLMWIGDLDGWAANCARLLSPGGTFYLLDIHPLAMALQQTESGLQLIRSYFGGGQPTVTEADASYAVRDVGLVHRATHEWIHPVGDVVTALSTAGIMIEFLHEHAADDFAPTNLSPTQTQPGVADLPALYSVRGHRPS